MIELEHVEVIRAHELDEPHERVAFRVAATLRDRDDVVLVHGTEDDVVPISQSRGYAERDPLAELVELDGADHFDVLELDHPGWQAVVEWLPAQLG